MPIPSMRTKKWVCIRATYTMFTAIREITMASGIAGEKIDAIVMENAIPTATNISLIIENTGTVPMGVISENPIKSIDTNTSGTITAKDTAWVIKAMGVITAEKNPATRFPNISMTTMATGIKSAGRCVMTNMARAMLWREADIKSGNV